VSTSLSVFWSNFASSTLASANKLYTTGGSPANTWKYSRVGTATGYGEITSQGTTGAWAAAGSLPAPTGKGSLLDSTLLEGQQLLAGLHTCYLRLNCAQGGDSKPNAGTLGAGLYVRLSKYHGGTYTTLLTLSLTGQTIGSSYTTYTLTGTAGSPTTFGSGDKLYVDIWVNVTSNGNGSSIQDIRLNRLSTDSANMIGDATNAGIVTPGFISAATPVTRRASGRVKLALTGTTSKKRATGRVGVARPTSGGLAVYAGGNLLNIHEPSGVDINDRANASSNATFTVVSDVAQTLSERQYVEILSGGRGLVFSGTIDKIETAKLVPSAWALYTVTCVDSVDRARRRIYTGDEMSGRLAGDVVVGLHQDYLAAEGISAVYAIDHDRDVATWSAGTHSNTTGANGNLELAPAGVVYNKLETTTSDFNTGTLTNVVGTNNSLQYTTQNAIKVTGTANATANAGGHLYANIKIWSGSISVVSTDYLSYEIWVDSRSPLISGGIDVVCTDGSKFSSIPVGGKEQFLVQPATDLQGFANDQWFYNWTNTVGVGWSGKTISYATVTLAGDKDGTYTFYIKNFVWKDVNGNVKATFYGNSGPLNTSQQLSTIGFQNVSVSLATVPYTSATLLSTNGVRVSPAYSLNAVGIAADSLISWESSLPIQVGGSSTYGQQLTVETSLDGGATWQACTNHAPIPGLYPGMKLTGRTITLRQTLAIAGPNPELMPVLNACEITVLPAAAATKTDVWSGTAAGSFGGGTLTNLANNAAGLQFNGSIRDWNDEIISNQSVFGPSVPAQAIGQRNLWLYSNTTDVWSQLTFAGQHQNFTAEMDVQFVAANTAGIGMQYRTTYWSNTRDSYCYLAQITSTLVSLGHGYNAATGTWVTIATASFTPTDGNWYRLKVVANGTSHKVYIDDILYINATDSFRNAAGYFGAYYNNNTVVRNYGSFDNFGVIDQTGAITGSYVAPSTSISAVGTVLNSYIDWDISNIPIGTTVDVQASTNGGGTYTSCTLGAAIPGCLPGTNVAGLSLLIKINYTTNNANAMPTVTGIGWTVSGAYSASGVHTSDALPLVSVGRAGSTSLAWVAEIPTGTSVTAETSTNGTSWSSATNGGAITGIAGQSDPVTEDFDADNSANFTSTFYTGGAVATYTWDTANSKLSVVGGTNAVYAWNSVSAKDKLIEATLYQSQYGGLLARYTDADNHYRLEVRDNQASTNPNTILLYRRVAGVNTLLDSKPIIFVRGTYHTVQWSLLGNTLSYSFDGNILGTLTDGSPITASGKTGFFNGSGTAYWQSLRVTAQGDDLTGKSAWYRLTLTSTDPLLTPKVSDATLSVRSPDIMSGAVMPSTSMKNKKVDICTEDAAKVSNYWWNIDKDKRYLFQSRPARFAPWPLDSSDVNFLATPIPKLTKASPLYRNRQYITGAYDIVTIVEQKKGDGITQSWPLSGKVQSINSISVNTQVRTFGTDDKTGLNYYYRVGEISLSQDKGATPLADGETLTISYVGMVEYTAMKEDTTQQGILAALDGSSGIVEEREDIPGIDKATADAIAQARIDQYAKFTRQWSYPTKRPGLEVGMLQSIFVPEYSLNDTDMLISAIHTHIMQKFDGTVLEFFDVSATEGPPIGNALSRLFQLVS
jgi:hypothetical protein